MSSANQSIRKNDCLCLNQPPHSSASLRMVFDWMFGGPTLVIITAETMPLCWGREATNPQFDHSPKNKK